MTHHFERYIVLFIPWLLSLLFVSEPNASYLIAWLGSFAIFYLSLSGWIRPLPNDLPVSEQLMRPIYLVQIVFAGYTCCSSFFYYLDVLGYKDFHKMSDWYLVDMQNLLLTAKCQRYYCLGHAAFVAGILMSMRYPIKPTYRIEPEKIANLLLIAAIIALPVSIWFSSVPGLTQFSSQLSSLSFVAGTLALAFAIPLHKLANTILCLFLYAFNFYQALLSGFKEPIILSVLILGLFLYPSYKKTVLVVFVPALLILFMLLPTYNRIFRENAWSEDVSAEKAGQLALNAALSRDDPNDENSNWNFLALRLSEIDMFTRFVKSTPEKVDFYGFQLVKQSAVAIVPRIFWPSKPITEDLVMERVYNGDVVNRGSNVSAKPAFIVDAYLSGGTAGVFIALLLYGITAQLISAYAEKLFGGYTLGTALIFSGLFQIFWRGLSFEFLINTVFWSFITMLLIHKILVAMHILKRI